MSAGLVFDLRKFSLHDGPGIRTAVFLKGCPLACPWCHNPEGRDGRPAILIRGERCVGCLSCAAACPLGLDPRRGAGGADCAACPDFGACARACPAEALQLVGARREVGELMGEIRKDRAFYEASGGGLTVSGGEPLAQPAFLGELLDAARREGIHTAIETSGFARREVFLDIAARADLLLFDLKSADPVRASALLGVDYGICLGNLGAAIEAEGGGSAEVVVRVPLIPGFNGDAEELEAMARLLASLETEAGAGKGREVHILPYHASARGKYRLMGLDYVPGDLAPPGEAAIEAALRAFSERGFRARAPGLARAGSGAAPVQGGMR